MLVSVLEKGHCDLQARAWSYEEYRKQRQWAEFAAMARMDL